MIKFLLKVALVLVVGITAYNYMFGDEAEKEQSREMVGKVRDIGGDMWKLLKAEKNKMDEGKYDDALAKLDNLYTDLKDKARDVKDSGALERLEELAKRRGELEEMLGQEGDELSRAGKRKLEDLTQDTEVLMHEMEAQSRTTAPQ